VRAPIAPRPHASETLRDQSASRQQLPSANRERWFAGDRTARESACPSLLATTSVYLTGDELKMKRTSRAISTDLLYLIQVLVAAMALLLIFAGFFDASCARTCNYESANIALWVMVGVSVGVPATTAVLIRIHDKPPRPNWIVLSGIALIGLSYVICRGLEAAAYDVPFVGY
jgi:uncharacterized membrane protein YhaH (DUF805 family)